MLFNQVGVLLVLIVAAFVAYVILGQPAWVMDPLRGAVSDVLGGMGVAIVLLLAWAGWLGWLLSRGFRVFFRKWRYVLGLGLLTAGAFALLSYFHAEFPLIGTAPLGGELGGQMRGSYGGLGVFRTVVLITLGAWLVAPVLFNHAALWLGRGAHAAGRGIGAGVSRLRRREQGSVMQEVDDYLTSNAVASRAAQMEALRAADEYRREAAVQSAIAQRESAPRGLAYLEPTSPKPLTPRPAEPDARPERKSASWPGLKPTESGAPEPRPSIAATATMAPVVDEAAGVEPATSGPTHQTA